MNNFNNLENKVVAETKITNSYNAWRQKTLKEHVDNNSLDLADRAIDEINFCEYALKDGTKEDVDEALKRIDYFGDRYEQLKANLLMKKDNYADDNKMSQN